MATKAYIDYMGKLINWRYENMWNTKWSIYDSEGNHIKYQGSSTNGRINTNLDNDLLLLTGLYITNYYWQLTIAVIVAVFIPIWITVF
ncbi:MAG: hypothetical protein HQ541_18975 [Mariniphaga sp.]|nr:hypothetical protein [Mariniphaga sp.]